MVRAIGPRTTECKFGVDGKSQGAEFMVVFLAKSDLIILDCVSTTGIHTY